MKRNILLGIILSGTSLSTFAQSSDIQKPITITPNISIQNFDWREGSTVGTLGVKLQFHPTKKINFSVDGGVFNSLGNTENTKGNPVAIAIGDKNNTTGLQTPISYNGLGTTGSPITSLQGGFINLDAGIPIKLGDSSRTSIEPFVGIEGKIWNRSADYGSEGNPIMVEEKFKFLSPSFGAKLNYNTKSKIKLSLRISASYPVVSKLKTDSKNLSLSNSEIDLTKMLSPSIELGARIKKVTLKLRFERINVGLPDSMRTCSGSSANVTGITVGYDF
jgi:hypothetical protein